MLKGRFQCLKGLRTTIRSPEDQALAIEMVRICLVLHNLILEVEHAPDDIGEWEWVIEGLDDDMEGLADDFGGDDDAYDGVAIDGSSKRAQVHAVLLQQLYDE
jgi:hypothetical protein